MKTLFTLLVIFISCTFTASATDVQTNVQKVQAPSGYTGTLPS